MSGPQGKFLWYELMTTDPNAAPGFYQNVVGWGTAPWDAPEGAEMEGPYAMIMNGETPLGGLMELPEEAKAAGAPPHWLPYIGTEDVDATVERATELGASVLHGPMSIPDVGRICILADPQGAVFAIYTPAGEPPQQEEGAPETGTISWHELGTTDWEAAWGFYSNLFGWEQTDQMDMGEGAIYQMYGQDDATYGGIFTKPPEMPGPAAWLLYAMVDDVEPAAEKVTELGGQVLNGPMDVPGGDRIVQCMDPQGAAFALHSKSQQSDS